MTQDSNPELGKLRKEAHKFKARLDYVMLPVSKDTPPQKKGVYGKENSLLCILLSVVLMYPLLVMFLHVF